MWDDNIGEKNYKVKVSLETDSIIPRLNPPCAFPQLASMLNLFQAASSMVLPFWLSASVSAAPKPCHTSSGKAIDAYEWRVWRHKVPPGWSTFSVTSSTLVMETL